MAHDTLIVGAGVAGLTAARALHSRGASVLVLERARGVGGRCATRRVDGQPVDHGVAFLHGRDRRFLSALSELERAALLEGWPTRVSGRGLPCQPEAFDPSERRYGCCNGISQFPKRLAAGLDVRLNADVVRLTSVGTYLGAALATGEEVLARMVVLAMPVPQALRLLEPLAQDLEHLARVLTVLGTVRYASSLTLIARFPGRSSSSRRRVDPRSVSGAMGRVSC